MPTLRKKLEKGGYYYFSHYPVRALGRAFSSPFDWFFETKIISQVPENQWSFPPPPIIKWDFSWKVVLLPFVFPVPLLKVVYNFITYPIKYLVSKSIEKESNKKYGVNSTSGKSSRPHVQKQEIAPNSAKPEQQAETSNFLEVLKSDAVQKYILKYWEVVDRGAWAPTAFSRILDDSPLNLELKGIMELFLPSLQNKQDNLGEYWKKLIYLKICIDIFAQDGSVKLEVLEALGARFKESYEATTKGFKEHLFKAYLMNIGANLLDRQTVVDVNMRQALEQVELANAIIDKFIIEDIGKEAFEKLTRDDLSDKRTRQGLSVKVCQALISAGLWDSDSQPIRPSISAMLHSLSAEVKIDDVSYFVAEQRTSIIQFLETAVGKIRDSITQLPLSDKAQMRAVAEKINTLINLINEHIKISQSMFDKQSESKLNALKSDLMQKQVLIENIAKLPQLKNVLSAEGELIADASSFESGAFLHTAISQANKLDGLDVHSAKNILDAVKAATALDARAILKGQGKTDNAFELLRNGNLMNKLIEGSQEVVQKNIGELVKVFVEFYAEIRREKANTSQIAGSSTNPPLQNGENLDEAERNVKQALKRLISTSWRPFGVRFTKGGRMSPELIEAVGKLINAKGDAEFTAALTLVEKELSTLDSKKVNPKDVADTRPVPVSTDLKVLGTLPVTPRQDPTVVSQQSGMGSVPKQIPTPNETERARGPVSRPTISVH